MWQSKYCLTEGPASADATTTESEAVAAAAAAPAARRGTFQRHLRPRPRRMRKFNMGGVDYIPTSPAPESQTAPSFNQSDGGTSPLDVRNVRAEARAELAATRLSRSDSWKQPQNKVLPDGERSSLTPAPNAHMVPPPRRRAPPPPVHAKLRRTNSNTPSVAPSTSPSLAPSIATTTTDVSHSISGGAATLIRKRKKYRAPPPPNRPPGVAMPGTQNRYHQSRSLPTTEEEKSTFGTLDRQDSTETITGSIIRRPHSAHSLHRASSGSSVYQAQHPRRPRSLTSMRSYSSEDSQSDFKPKRRAPSTPPGPTTLRRHWSDESLNEAHQHHQVSAEIHHHRPAFKPRPPAPDPPKESIEPPPPPVPKKTYNLHEEIYADVKKVLQPQSISTQTDVEEQNGVNVDTNVEQSTTVTTENQLSQPSKTTTPTETVPLPPLPPIGALPPPAKQPLSSSSPAVATLPRLNTQLQQEIASAAADRADRPVDVPVRKTGAQVFENELKEAYKKREKRREGGTYRMRPVKRVNSVLYKAKSGSIKIPKKPDQTPEWTPDQDLEDDWLEETPDDNVITARGSDMPNFSQMFNPENDLSKTKYEQSTNSTKPKKKERYGGSLRKFKKSMKSAMGSLGRSFAKNSMRKKFPPDLFDSNWEIYHAEDYDEVPTGPIKVSHVEKRPAYAFNAEKEQLLLLPDYENVIVTEDGKKIREAALMRVVDRNNLLPQELKKLQVDKAADNNNEDLRENLENALARRRRHLDGERESAALTEKTFENVRNEQKKGGALSRDDISIHQTQGVPKDTHKNVNDLLRTLKDTLPSVENDDDDGETLNINVPNSKADADNMGSNGLNDSGYSDVSSGTGQPSPTSPTSPRPLSDLEERSRRPSSPTLEAPLISNLSIPLSSYKMFAPHAHRRRKDLGLHNGVTPALFEPLEKTASPPPPFEEPLTEDADKEDQEEFVNILDTFDEVAHILDDIDDDFGDFDFEAVKKPSSHNAATNSVSVLTVEA